MNTCLAEIGLPELSNIFTIVTCVVAVITLIIGVWQFLITQRSTRESQAVELFSKFNQLNIDLENSEEVKSHRWYKNSMFAITESLYEISSHSETWRSTIKWMLGQQRDFINEGGFEVGSYSSEFRLFCTKHGYELKES